jgi:hypothetical protein
MPDSKYSNSDVSTYFDDFSFDLNTIINKSSSNERLINTMKKDLSAMNDQVNELQKSKSIALLIAGLSLSGKSSIATSFRASVIAPKIQELIPLVFPLKIKGEMTW